MAYFRDRAATAIEALVEADPCDPKEIMRLQNLVARADEYQGGVEELLQAFKSEEDRDEIELENAEDEPGPRPDQD